MAGSWQHMTTKSGKLRNNETFCDMIENLGDAYEAAEECYGMIWWLARKLEICETDRENPPRELILDMIREAESNYQDGLRIGRIQKAG